MLPSLEFCELRNFPLVNFLNRWHCFSVVALLTSLTAHFCHVCCSDELFNPEQMWAFLRDYLGRSSANELWQEMENLLSDLINSNTPTSACLSHKPLHRTHSASLFLFGFMTFILQSIRKKSWHWTLLSKDGCAEGTHETISSQSSPTSETSRGCKHFLGGSGAE